MSKQPITYPAFVKALPLLEHIEANGFEAYFVGGSVRDALLKKPVNDIDIATSATPEEIKAIFKRTVDIGIEHGTVLVLAAGGEYEVTTFRTESTYQDFRRPDEVTFVRSLKEDLQRRDFTINALALSQTGELIDFYGGQADLDRQLIRAVGCPKERFSEDALRMMRAIRFSSQLDFNIEHSTFLAIKDLHSLLQHIATERIATEFEKTLLGKNYGKALHLLVDTGLYKYCPGLQGCAEAINHLSSISTPFLNIESAWALLIYMLQETQCLSGKLTDARSFLRQWKLSNKKIDQSLTLLEGLIYRMTDQPLTPDFVFQLGLDCSLMVEDLVQKLGRPSQTENIRHIYDQLAITKKEDLAISGRDIMALKGDRAGTWVGKWLREALNTVVRGQIPNQKDKILNYLKEQHNISGGGD